MEIKSYSPLFAESEFNNWSCIWPESLVIIVAFTSYFSLLLLKASIILSNAGVESACTAKFSITLSSDGSGVSGVSGVSTSVPGSTTSGVSGVSASFVPQAIRLTANTKTSNAIKNFFIYISSF